jgi:hypothetical protein
VKKIISTLLIIVLMFTMVSCIAVDAGGKKVENQPTLGQQLIDLKKARDEGALSKIDHVATGVPATVVPHRDDQGERSCVERVSGDGKLQAVAPRSMTLAGASLARRRRRRFAQARRDTSSAQR